jgi:hypothetical protein
MNALIRKEIRLIIWPWIAALILATAPGWLCASHVHETWQGNLTAINDTIIQVSLYAFALGCVVLALTAFGQEFTLRTFTLTLSQPIDRKKIWRTKTVILAIAIGVVAAAAIISLHQLIATYWQVPPRYDPYTYFSNLHRVFNDRARAFPGSALAAILIAVTAFSGALWTTLLFRNFFTALSLTILLPSVLLVCGSRWIFGEPARYGAYFATIGFGTYSLAGFIFARFLFLGAQDVIWTGENISLSSANTKRFALFTSFPRTNRFSALVRKEFQLQQATFIVAGLMIVIHVASLALRPLISPDTRGGALATLVNFVFIIWLTLPVLVGSASIAEERRFGTMETQLTQPVPRSIQLLVKLTITLLLSFVFGCVAPFLVEKLAGTSGATKFILQPEFRPLVLTSITLGAIAFFSSTTARSSLDAFCLSIVAIGPVVAVAGFFSSENPWTGSHPFYGLISPYICAVIFGPTIIWCVWRNYRRIQVRWTAVATTWLTVAISVFAAWGTCSFVWNRGWEVFMQLEPKHGTPVMSLSDDAKVLSLGNGAAALLPDGRLWVTDYNYDIVHEPNRRHEEHVLAVTLKNPHFLAGTWKDIAAHGELYAIKADHTLWNLRPSHRETNSSGHTKWKRDPAYQIATDYDWASITCGESFALALKQDGSLWGWGSAGTGALGPIATNEVSAPIKIWPGTYWTKIFASGAFCFGIQTNGTTWQWGDITSLVGSTKSELQASHFASSQWKSFYAFYPVQYAIRGDGTLWTYIPERWLGNVGLRWMAFGDEVNLASGAHQLGNDHDWRQLTSMFQLCALKTNGTWLARNRDAFNRPNGRGNSISRYSDWMAIDSGSAAPIGLATDGTISAWMSTDSYPYYTARSRRPTWSTNIFATH